MGKGALVSSNGIIILFSSILLSGTVFAVPNAFATFNTIPNLTSATAVAGGGVVLVWNQAAISVETFTAYTVMRNTSPSFDPLSAGVEICNESAITTTTCTDLTGTDGTQYWYELTYQGSVTAKTAGGTELTATPDSTPPGALTAVSISSNNVNAATLAKFGNTVFIAYTLPEPGAIVTSVTIGGQAASTANPATLVLNGAGLEGLLIFSIAFTDAAGNAGPTKTTVDDASSVTSDFTAPTVLISENSNAILNLLDTIADDDVTEDNDLTVTLTYNEPMSTAPTISFVADSSTNVETSGTLVPQNTGSFNGPSLIFTRIYNLADVGETQAGVYVGVSGAADLAGNVQISNSLPNAFNVDTKNPEIAPATLTIVSNNNFDSAFPGEVAKNGDIITITLASTETLLTEEAGDVTIQGVSNPNADVTVGVSGPTLTATLAVDTSDTQGDVLFSITYRDLVRNLGATATNAQLTNPLQKVVLDYTAPPIVSVSINGGDLRTFARLVDLSLGCNDANGLILVAGCFKYRVVGDELPDTEPFVIATLYPATAQTTVTSERGLKTVSVTYVDRAGNFATDTTDTIKLDPFFTDVVFGIAPAAPTPPNVQGLWEDFEFDISGKITHPQVLPGTQDKVRVDFNYFANANPTFDFPAGFTFPSNIVVLDIAPTLDPDVFTFSTSTLVPDSREFPRPSQDQVDINNLFTHLHTGEATLVESDGVTVVSDSAATPIPVDEDTSNQAEVLEHPISIVADSVANPNAGNRFFAGGRLSDPLVGPVPGKLISFEDFGAPTDLLDAITQGITFTDPTEIVIDNCSGCSPADDIMRLNALATITPSKGATYVSLYLRNMGAQTVIFRVTNGDSPPSINDFTITTSATDITVLTLTDPSDIAQIKILSLTGVGKVGLSSVKTFGSELGAIHTIDFTAPVSGITSKTFDEGRYYSEGTSQTGIATLELDEVFAGDDDYVTSTSSVTYSILESTTAGVSSIGGGAGTLVSDDGKGIVSILCSSDDDLDALCNSWENLGANAGSGVPFTVNGVTYYYQLTNTNTQSDDLLVEIDAMTNHDPNDASLATAVSTFAAEGVTLRHIQNDLALTHVDTIGVWSDTDLIDNNDFNSLKNDWFGTSSERPVISSQTAQNSATVVPTVVSTSTPSSASVSGITLGIPNQNSIVPNGATEGRIIIKTKLTVSASNEVHVNTAGGTAGFDVGEGIYRDVDWSTTVNAGDVRLGNTGSFGVNSVVLAADSDAVAILGLVAFGATEKHVDNGATAGLYDSGEAIYKDVDGLDTVNAGDKRLLHPTLSVGAAPGTGVTVASGNADLVTPQTPLVKFSPLVSVQSVLQPSSSVTGLSFQTVTASVSSTATSTQKILTITVPFRYTPASWTSFSFALPQITTTFSIPLSTSKVTAQVTNPGSPQVFTTLLDAKAQAYRYAIWAHTFGGPSGQSEVKGNDLVITLGSGFSDTLSGHTGSIGNANEQAGTYIHELGHILNLAHGGGDSINCKPNYFSVMSYSRQLSTYVDASPAAATWAPIFSQGTHSPLTESSLVETTGIGGTASETGVYGSPVSPASTPPAHAAPDHTNHQFTGSAGGIDWNDSGGAPSGTVSADINNFGITGCGAGSTITNTAYNDYDDSTLFNFNFRDGISGQFDGITILLSDTNSRVRYQQILSAGTFDGLDPPIPNNKAKPGSTVPIRLDITTGPTNVIDVPNAHGRVFVSFGNINGPYQMLTNQLTGTNDVLWVPSTHQIQFNWKTKSTDPEGAAFFRVYLLENNGPGIIGGLAADFNALPGNDFLKDLVTPYKLKSGEKHRETTVNGLFDVGEGIYDDLDSSNTVTVGDKRLANPPSGFSVGSTVKSGNSDVGTALVAFASNEKHSDKIGEDFPRGLFDAGEAVYRDVTAPFGTVSVGDIRLANPPTGSPGFPVAAGNIDVGKALVPFVFEVRTLATDRITLDN